MTVLVSIAALPTLALLLALAARAESLLWLEPPATPVPAPDAVV
jgi:hypothetical protein